MSRTPLVRFSLNNINCLIAAHSLNFLADVDEGMQVVVAGEFNDRKQIVARIKLKKATENIITN